MRRFLWRLKIMWKLKSLESWKHTRWLDNRPPTKEEIRIGQELAKELGLEAKECGTNK